MKEIINSEISGPANWQSQDSYLSGWTPIIYQNLYKGLQLFFWIYAFWDSYFEMSNGIPVIVLVCLGLVSPIKLENLQVTCISLAAKTHLCILVNILFFRVDRF